ncbi:MAG: hypothetical protein ABI743_00130 [bacterium]
MHSLAERLEQLAEGLHDHFVADAAAQGFTPLDDVFYRFWSELPDEQQEAYRDAIRALAHGVEAYGVQIVAAMAPRGGIDSALLYPHIDQLAALAHTVWYETLLKYGWTYSAAASDLVKRTNPWLEPWDRLSQAKQDRVRAFLHGLPELLPKYGLRLEQFDPAHAAPEHPSLHHHLDASPTPPPTPSVAPAPPPVTAAPTPHPQLPPAMLEQIAVAWHAAYVQHHIEAGESLRENPALRPWEHLHPELQAVVREEASHLWEWVHTVGFTIAPQTGSGKAVEQFEVDAVATALAEVEHEFWQTTLRDRGWEPGRRPLGAPVDAARLHPQLVQWDRLRPSSKAAERAVMHDLPAILASAGLRLVHLR